LLPDSTIPSFPGVEPLWIGNMDLPHKRDVHTSHTERSSSTMEIRQVQNVAFADATAKANVRPWTKAMFKVGSINVFSRA
jgi:hypothetical protein